MQNNNLFGLPAALALLSLSTTTVASAIAVPVEKLEDELEFGGELSGDESRRVRAFLWGHGVLLIGAPLCAAILYLAPLAGLRRWTIWAEGGPARQGEGLAFAAFSYAWRFWLRITGQGHRLRNPANDVQPMAGGGAAE